jgi:hypothetical protein
MVRRLNLLNAGNYVDYGVLRDQILESRSDKIQIKELFLKSIKDSTLVLEARIYNLKNEFKVNEKISVHRADTKGLLYRTF